MDASRFFPLALSAARDAGASYADVRFTKTEWREVFASDGVLDSVETGVSQGVGVRCIVGDAWGFSATNSLGEDDVVRAAREAAAVARASSRARGVPVELAPNPVQTGVYETPTSRDPLEVPIEEVRDLLLGAVAAASSVEGISSSSAFVSGRRVGWAFASTEGANLRQTVVHTGTGLSASAGTSHRDRASRSYPTSGGQYESRGYELVESLDLVGNAKRTGEEAVALASAEQCPDLPSTTVILEGSMLSLQIHESVGHALELDRVFGGERNFSGSTFATPDGIGSLRYGSGIVSFDTDASAPGGLGTFGWDDDGVPAIRHPIIEKGVLTDYLSNRTFASRIRHGSTGCNRADGWGNIPIVRMTNTVLRPGSGTLDDLISGVDDGIFIATPASWSIDDERYGFTLGGEVGWRIQGGQLRGMIRRPQYSGNTPGFWNSCRAIAGESEYRVWGTPNCGKGQPGQNARTGQGTSPALFENVRVGGGS